MTMTPALTAAAERLIALPGFRWMPGMVDVNGNRFVDVSEGIIEIDGGLFQFSRGHYSAASPALPDLTDPATLGCVERMVEEAWKHPICPLQCTGHEGFNVFEAWLDDETFSSGRTKIECLVNALAAAAGDR